MDFKVGPGKDSTKEDITVEAKLRRSRRKPAEGTEDDIVVVAKTTKLEHIR